MLLESTWYLYSFIQLSSNCNESHGSGEIHLNNQEAAIGNRHSSMQLTDIHSFAVDIVLVSVILFIKLDCWN